MGNCCSDSKSKIKKKNNEIRRIYRVIYDHFRIRVLKDFSLKISGERQKTGNDLKHIIVRPSGIEFLDKNTNTYITVNFNPYLNVQQRTSVLLMYHGMTVVNNLNHYKLLR